MSDATLQRALRQARETEHPDDRSRALRALLRAGYECSEFGCDHCPACGGLSLQQRISLAAYCNDAASRQLLGWPPSDEAPRFGYPTHPARSYDGQTVGSTNDPLIWVGALSYYGRLVMVRAGLAVGELVHCEPLCASQTGPCSISEALARVRAWAEQPTQQNRWKATEVPPPFVVGSVWGDVGQLLLQPPTATQLYTIKRLQQIVRAGLRLASEQDLVDAIRRELAGWALP